jgi:hypothetical protein
MLRSTKHSSYNYDLQAIPFNWPINLESAGNSKPRSLSNPTEYPHLATNDITAATNWQTTPFTHLPASSADVVVSSRLLWFGSKKL